MQYITLTELSEHFNGVYTFGTSGTNFASEGAGTRNISRNSGVIDLYLSPKYGTYSPLFGTSGAGTCDVPSVIKSVCADLTLGVLFQNSALNITDTQKAFGLEIYNRGMDLLKVILEGNNIYPHNGTVENTLVPVSSSDVAFVYGEQIGLTGTTFVPLTYSKLIKTSLRVYGTSDLNPVSYVEGRDYEALYYQGTGVGLNYGQIRTHGTGSIAAGQTVRVDYAYRLDSVFRLNDFDKWGEVSKEHR